MKKLSILAAILAIGTMCITGCDMGGANSTENVLPGTHNIAVQDQSADATEEPAPGDDCENGDNCCHDKMPHKRPSFKFRAPQGKYNKRGRNKFRHPHKRPKPVPNDPETPAAPEENYN